MSLPFTVEETEAQKPKHLAQTACIRFLAWAGHFHSAEKLAFSTSPGWNCLTRPSRFLELLICEAVDREQEQKAPSAGRGK